MHGPSMTDPANSDQRGLIPRTLEYLFAQIAREQRKSVRCFARRARRGNTRRRSRACLCVALIAVLTE